MTQLRTLFYRCGSLRRDEADGPSYVVGGCGAELVHTVDLDSPRATVRSGRLPVCHCGLTMILAPIPRMALPKSGDYDREEVTMAPAPEA